MDVHIVHQSKVEFKEAKNKWKSRWAILEKSDRNVPPEDIDQDNMRHSSCTSLVIRKNKEGEVRLAIPLYYLCLVDKYSLDRRSYGITLMVANKMSNTAETYLIQCDTQAETDVWLDYFQSIVGAGMHKFEIKLPKIIKTKYNGPGWLYFYEEQKFVTITSDSKVPVYYGTWPIQLLRRYGGDDPNKFVFESGRRCFGGVNIYHVASPQAYDIRALCNKVSSSRAATTGCLANATLTGYADTEPRYRNYPGNPRTRPGERPLTVVSNGSVASNASKRSSGSSSGGDPVRQQSLDRGMRPMSDTIDSGISFRSSNNSILSNRSSRGSYSSDINIAEEVDSGVDTLDSRAAYPIQLPLHVGDGDPQDMYMVMQPTMPAISEARAGGGQPPRPQAPGGGQPPRPQAPRGQAPHVDEYGGMYETMVHGNSQEGYTTLRNNGWQQQPNDSMSNYMVPKPVHYKSAPQSPMSPMSPMSAGSKIPGMSPCAKQINYPPLPPTTAQVPADSYMNMDDYNSAPSSHSPYMNIDALPSNGAPSNYMNIDTLPPSSNYMNIDTLSRSFDKSASLDTGAAASYSNIGTVTFTRAQSTGPSYGNYMNMPSLTDSPVSAKKIPVQPIYDTPTNHVRAYANVDNKLIAMSVSNPIYGNCSATPQKLQT